MPKKKTLPAKPPKKDDVVQSPALPAPATPLTVVGIAASAGGLKAFKSLFSALPAHTGVAFVLVPHLDPSHASLMVELLRPYAKMAVREVQDGLKMQPGMVYIIPPNRKLEIHDGVLHLSQLTGTDAHYTPIDPFFRSLAEDQKERAVGIVLSGTGSHGTLGLQAIKANGGMTMVQDPAEAEYDQMPRSAIAADVVDHVLPVARMPEALNEYVKHPYVNGKPPSTETGQPSDYLGKILTLIRARTKYNFKDYRKNMLIRRIQRRMSLNHIEDPNTYVEMLRDNADELHLLFQDFLIGVSGFFRDPEAFAALAKQVIPELFRLKADGDTPIRIWVPGCATGEEAYSIAMLLYEEMDRVKKHPPFQIFATDINEQGLKTARVGVYPDSIATDVSLDRLRRFFVKTDHYYHVNKHLREPVMFAAQNVISDTPFSKLDLICCRNLLIYLEPEIQQKVLALFHFALNEVGYLFLGASETVGRQIDLFEAVSKKWRIFKRIGPSRPDRLEFSTGNHHILPTQPLFGAETKPRATKIGALAQELLIDTYVPACVLINRRFEILYLHGPTRNYLSMPSGEPTHDLLALAYPGLNGRIRSLCYQVKDSRDGEVHGEVSLKQNGHYARVRIGVKEIREPKALNGLMLVTFEDAPYKEQAEPVNTVEAADKNTVVQQLEFELKATREDLQSTIEELESSNEELKSSNEEMMSMNEELQSVNEELETSKEELQSLNEELNTVNNQLEGKVEELDKVNNDLLNLLKSSEIATIFLDTNLQIRRFTPATVKLLNLVPADIGRSINDFSYNFKDDGLIKDARTVLEHLSPIDKHVWASDGSYYLRRILPYRTAENRIEGVVITFVDIMPQMMAAEQSRRLAALLKDSNDAIIMKDLNGRILTWNRAAERMYGYSHDEALQMNILDLVSPGERDEMRAYLTNVASGKRIETIEMGRVAKDGRLLQVSMTATRLVDDTGNVVTILGTERDMTSRHRLEQELRALNTQLEQRVADRTKDTIEKAARLQEREMYLTAILDTAPDAIITVDAAGVIKSCNPAAKNMLGCTENDVAKTHISRFFPSLVKDQYRTVVEKYLHKSDPGTIKTLWEVTGRTRDRIPITVEMSISRIDEHDLYVAIARDISDRKNMEKEVIEASSWEQERIGREIHDGLGQRLTALTMMVSQITKRLTAQKHTERDILREITKQLRKRQMRPNVWHEDYRRCPNFLRGWRPLSKHLCKMSASHRRSSIISRCRGL